MPDQAQFESPACRCTKPKLHVEQIPQIAPCAAALTIVLRNTDICRRLFHRLLYNPLCAAACRRLSSTRLSSTTAARLAFAFVGRQINAIR